jgi:hypothetical protein
VDAISPELVLIDPALAHAERPVAVPVVRDHEFGRADLGAPSREERVNRVVRRRSQPVWEAALLVSLLANGFLTAFMLFGEHAQRPPVETSIGSSKLPGTVASSVSVTWVPGPDIPPIQPSSGRFTHGAAQSRR